MGDDLADRVEVAIDDREHLAREALRVMAWSPVACDLAQQALGHAEIDRDVLTRHRGHRCPNLSDVCRRYEVGQEEP